MLWGGDKGSCQMTVLSQTAFFLAHPIMFELNAILLSF